MKTDLSAFVKNKREIEALLWKNISSRGNESFAFANSKQALFVTFKHFKNVFCLTSKLFATDVFIPRPCF